MHLLPTRLAFALLLVLPATARAYQESGHFYTVVSALESHTPAYDPAQARQARVVGFCAQLPDLASELDAITARVHLSVWEQFSWGLLSQCAGEQVHRMVATQHYVHALTGADHRTTLTALQQTAQQLLAQMRQDPNDWTRACALGVAMHGVGDAFAHSRLDRGEVQYPTGLGHFRDKTHPDHPLYDPARFELYKTYLQQVNTSLGVALSDAQLARIDAVGQTLLQQAERDKDYDEPQLIAALRGLWGNQAADWAPYDPTLERVHAGQWVLTQTCSSVVSQYATVLGVHLDCAAVWRTYFSVARAAFSAVPAVCPLPEIQEVM